MNKLGLGDALKEGPNVVWVCLTVILLGVLTSYVVLAATGANSDDLSRFINTLLNIVSLLVGSGGLAFGASAAVNSKRASEQTNGVLKPTIKDATKEAIAESLPLLKGENNDGTSGE